MPWCDPCQKYWAPSSLNDDGTCPRCGTDPDPPELATSRSAGDVDVDVDEKAPWHFKVMVGALIVYLVYRFGTMFFG